jgi:hypothetical protein
MIGSGLCFFVPSTLIGGPLANSVPRLPIGRGSQGTRRQAGALVHGFITGEVTCDFVELDHAA